MLKHGPTLALVVVLTNPLWAAAAPQEKEISGLSESLSSRITNTGKKTVAVTDMTGSKGCVTKLGRYLAEELAVGLAISSRGYSVVNRAHLRSVLAELKLGQSGLTDPATARQAGKLSGADALAVGSMTFFGDTVRVTVQVLDSETAATIAASAISIPRTAAIDKLEECVEDSAPSSTTDNLPFFRNTLIKVTATQLAINKAVNNERAVLSLIIENITQSTIALAFESDGNKAKLVLSDDRASDWGRPSSIIGLQQDLPVGMSIVGGRDVLGYSDIAPSEKVNVLVTFGDYRTDVDLMATTYNFIAQALQKTPAGQRKLTIGISGIRPTPPQR
jgi:TolB-like protein